jgi:hypothetical protein
MGTLASEAVKKSTVPQHVRCPACEGLDVRRSYPAGWRDRLMIDFGLLPLRCRACGHRFYRRLRPGDKLGRPDVSTDRAPIL